MYNPYAAQRNNKTPKKKNKKHQIGKYFNTNPHVVEKILCQYKLRIAQNNYINTHKQHHKFQITKEFF